MDPSRARNYYPRHPRNTALVGREAQVFFQIWFLEQIPGRNMFLSTLPETNIASENGWLEY